MRKYIVPRKEEDTRSPLVYPYDLWNSLTRTEKSMREAEKKGMLPSYCPTLIEKDDNTVTVYRDW